MTVVPYLLGLACFVLVLAALVVRDIWRTVNLLLFAWFAAGAAAGMVVERSFG